MEDTQEVEPVGFDPVKGSELLIWIHYESHGTLCLIPYKDYFFRQIISACQQAASFQWGVLVNIIQHFLPMSFAYIQLVLHLIIE